MEPTDSDSGQDVDTTASGAYRLTLARDLYSVEQRVELLEGAYQRVRRWIIMLLVFSAILLGFGTLASMQWAKTEERLSNELNRLRIQLASVKPASGDLEAPQSEAETAHERRLISLESLAADRAEAELAAGPQVTNPELQSAMKGERVIPLELVAAGHAGEQVAVATPAEERKLIPLDALAAGQFDNSVTAAAAATEAGNDKESVVPAGSRRKNPGPLAEDQYFVIINSTSSRPEALQIVQSLEAKGYESEVIRTASGYYGLALGRFEFERAKQVKQEAIANGIGRGTPYLITANPVTEYVYPPGAPE